MGLTGKQSQAFIKALWGRYELDLQGLDFVLRGIEKRVESFRAGGAVPKDIIANIVDEADREGWLTDLYLVIRPQVSELKAVGDESGLEATYLAALEAAAVPTAIAYDSSSILGFDLVALEQEFLRVRYQSRSPLVAFAVGYGEDPFLRFFCERMQAILGSGDTYVQERLALGGRFGATNRLDRVKPYAAMLGRGNLVCPIIAEDATANELEAFWRGVRELFPEPQRTLVLLFTVGPGAALPDGVNPLPDPQFTGNDIGGWTTQVAVDRGWGAAAGYEWRAFIEEIAADAGRLDIRVVYDYLQMTMPLPTVADLRAEIEKWRKHAVPASG